MPWSNSAKISGLDKLFNNENKMQYPSYLNTYDVNPVELILNSDQITGSVGLYSEIGGGGGVYINQNDLEVHPPWITQELYLRRFGRQNENLLSEHRAVIDSRL